MFQHNITQADWHSDSTDGRKGFEVLRRKWNEVPLNAMERMFSRDLLALPDDRLHDLWSAAWRDQATGPNYSVRGWYYTLYRDQFRGKRVIDFGSGLGYDAITFSGAGACITCVDLVESNLEVIQRIAKIRGHSVSTLWLEDFTSLAALEDGYDVVWCCGSLINSPFEFTRAECQHLLRHLKIGGRWVELAYPEIRWIREGRMPFEEWGRKTDGGAPWMEWKDLGKLLRMLSPAQFNVILDFNFYNDYFNWFDLERTG